jgi:hypothetical protein
MQAAKLGCEGGSFEDGPAAGSQRSGEEEDGKMSGWIRDTDAAVSVRYSLGSAQGTSSLVRTGSDQIDCGLVQFARRDDQYLCPVVSEPGDGTSRISAIARLTELRQRWIEVQPTEVLRDLAEVLLQRHPLRAADAMQLAAALIWAKQLPRKRVFVCLDSRLAEAASKEGFSVQTL